MKKIMIVLSFIYLSIFFLSSLRHKTNITILNNLSVSLFEISSVFYKGLGTWSFYTVPDEEVELRILHKDREHLVELEYSDVFKPVNLISFLSPISLVRHKMAFYRTIRYFPEKTEWLCRHYNLGAYKELYFIIIEKGSEHSPESLAFYDQVPVPSFSEGILSFLKVQCDEFK